VICKSQIPLSKPAEKKAGGRMFFFAAFRTMWKSSKNAKKWAPETQRFKAKLKFALTLGYVLKM